MRGLPNNSISVINEKNHSLLSKGKTADLFCSRYMKALVSARYCLPFIAHFFLVRQSILESMRQCAIKICQGLFCSLGFLACNFAMGLLDSLWFGFPRHFNNYCHRRESLVLFS